MTSKTESAYLPWLPYHLDQAGRTDDLRHLLFRYDWIEGQIRRSNLRGAIADYELLPEDSEARNLSRSLLLSRDVLASHPDQLTFQLCGRLSGSSGSSTRALLDQASDVKKRALWLRPVTPSLENPESPLQWALQASASAIDALVELEDGGFACASQGEVRIWDSDLEPSETVLKLEQGSITHLCRVAGNQLLTGSDEGSIHLWDLEHAKVVRSYRGHSSVISVLKARERSFVSVASKDDTIWCWNLADTEPLAKLVGHEKEINDTAFLEKNRLASVSNDRSLRLWNLVSGKQTHTGVLPKFPGTKVIPWKPRHLITGTFAGEMYIWKIGKRALRKLRRFRYPAIGLNALVLLHRDLGVSGIGGREGMQSWNPRTGQTRAESFAPGGDVVACARLNRSTVLCGTKGGYVSKVRIAPFDGNPEPEEARESVYSVAVIDDSSVASTASAGRIRIWDPHTGTERYALHGDKNLVAKVVVLGEDRLASVEMGSSEIRLWNLRTRECIAQLEIQRKVGPIHPLAPTLLAVAPPETVSDRSEEEIDRTIDLWAVDRGECIAKLPEMRMIVSTMLSIAGRFLIVGTYEGPILHFDISTYEDRRNFILDGHNRGVVALASPRGGLLISGSIDTSIRLWNLENQECMGHLEGHRREVTGLAPLGGSYLASASFDRTVRIWDFEAGQEIYRVDCDAGIHCLAVTPDRRHLVWGDERGQVHFVKVENLGQHDR